MEKIMVVGSGFGGLAAAIRLQAKGFQVTVFEKNSQVGGHASQLQKAGYTFDMGPSLITAPDIIDRVFESAGRQKEDYLDLTSLDPFYRICFHDGSQIDYTGDSERMITQMRQFNLKDAANYHHFMAHIRELYQLVIPGGLGSSPFEISTLLRFMPKAIKLNALQSCYRVVSKYFKDPRNRFMFSFHPLFIGGNPFRSPAVYLMIPYLEKSGGIWFAKGGMYSLVSALEKVFLEIGGQIKTNCEVNEIVVEHRQSKGVIANDVFHPADAVISNAHFGHTQLDLLKRKKRHKWHNRKVQKIAYSMSCFLIYIGVCKQYPQLLHHTLILSERYKESIYDIFDRKILADDFSMYLHTPTRSDPSMAPEGCESMYVLIPVPNLLANIDWQKMASSYTDKILLFLEEVFGLEQLRQHIEVLEVFTPEDFETQRNNYLGSAWGVEPRLSQTASFRPGNRSEDIKKLYLVGASTHPGAGVPGVLLTAEATEKVVLQDFKITSHLSAVTN